MPDAEIRGLLLQKYYRRRKERLIGLTPSDFDGAVNPHQIQIIAGQLADHGLIHWRASRGQGGSGGGMGTITPAGMDVVEGRTPAPLPIQLPQQSGRPAPDSGASVAVATDRLVEWPQATLSRATMASLPPYPHRLVKFEPPGAPSEEYFLPSDKLIAGNPRQCIWKQYADSSGKFFAGRWSSEIGKWRIAYTEEEYCQILHGTSIITDTDGNALTVSAGDSLVVPRGFVGTWEVIAPTHKIYVIYEP
jgi:uncharacterized cupin superfamily protein